MKKGFAHLIPLVIVALLLVGGFSVLSVRRQTSQKAAVGRVLSDKSGGGDRGDENSGGSSGGSSVNSISGSANSSEGLQDNKSSENSSIKKLEVKTATEVHKVEKKAEKEKTEVENEVETEKESSASAKFEEKIRAGGLKIEIKTEGNKTVVKVKDKTNQEVEVENELEDELLAKTDEILEKKDIKIATDSAKPGFVEHGRRVRTNFPLSVDPTTGQLFVTTPNGTKTVAILPASAIQNLIDAGVITRTQEPPSPLSNPPSGSGSATPSATSSVLGASTELTTNAKGTLVYKIEGVKNKKLIGLIPLELKLKTEVSAENGQLLNISESFFTKLLDLISF